MMITKQLLDIVSDFEAWRGDTYRLAALVAAAQQEADAQIAESDGATTTAAKIRGS